MELLVGWKLSLRVLNCVPPSRVDILNKLYRILNLIVRIRTEPIRFRCEVAYIRPIRFTRMPRSATSLLVDTYCNDP